MAYCRVYRPSDGPNVRICRKCNKCVVPDEFSVDELSVAEPKKRNQGLSCKLYQPEVNVPKPKLCEICNKCVATEDSDTSLETNRSTLIEASSCLCLGSIHQSVRNEESQISTKYKKSEALQTDHNSAEAKTIVIEIAKHPKNSEATVSNKDIEGQAKNNTSVPKIAEQNSKNQIRIAQEPSGKQGQVDSSTSYTVLSAGKKPSEVSAPAPSEEHSIKPLDEPYKKRKMNLFRKKRASIVEDPPKKTEEKRTEKVNANKTNESRQFGDVPVGTPSTQIKTVDDAKLYEELARIRKLLEKSTEHSPNTNTIILPTGSKIGDQSEDLKRLQDAFRDGAQNSKKDLQNVLNEVQKQKQEIATLKKLLNAFIDSYSERGRSITSPPIRVSQQEEIQDRPKRKKTSFIGIGDAEPDNKQRAAETGQPERERSETLQNASGTDDDLFDPENELKYKKPAEFEKKKQKKWWNRLPKKEERSRGGEDFETRHDPRRRFDSDTYISGPEGGDSAETEVKDPKVRSHSCTRSKRRRWFKIRKVLNSDVFSF